MPTARAVEILRRDSSLWVERLKAALRRRWDRLDNRKGGVGGRQGAEG